MLAITFLVGVLASCADQGQSDSKLVDRNFVVSPGETIWLEIADNISDDFTVSLASAPDWVLLVKQGVGEVKECPVSTGSCGLYVKEDALVGDYLVKLKFRYKDGSAYLETVYLHVVPSLSIVPSKVKLPTTGQVQFAAKVLGLADYSIDWIASCGEVNSAGLYTAPPVPSICRVEARVSEWNLVATAEIEVLQAAKLIVHVTPSDAVVRVSGPESYAVELQGGAVLYPILPGTYKINVDHPNFIPFEGNVELQPGETKEISIQLLPKPSFDLIPHLVLTNEGVDSDAKETTVEVGTVITVYWGLRVEPQDALADAIAVIGDTGVVVELYWKAAGDAEFQKLAKIYQKPSDEDRIYPLPPAEEGDNFVKVIVDPNNDVLELNEDNNEGVWIIHGISSNE